MKAMVYGGPYKVRVEEKPMPAIEHPNDAIVRVTWQRSAVPIAPFSRHDAGHVGRNDVRPRVHRRGGTGRPLCPSTGFFYQENYIHRHSGIGWHKPASVHFGTADTIDDASRATLTTAYHTTPARFGRRPHPPTRPDKAWINQPHQSYPNEPKALSHLT